jgi:hypothetical protein
MSRTDRQGGQILPVVLATLALAAAAIVLTHRSIRGIGQESAVVNAADAAAYSGASWTARRLNLIAYTNRSLIASHIAVGHLVATISWLRYSGEASRQISRYAQFLPYVGVAAREAQRLIDAAIKTASIAAGGYIVSADRYMDLLSLAQYGARNGLRPGRVDAVMQRVVERYGDDFQVNERSAIDAIPRPYATAMDARLLSRQVSAYLKLEGVTPGRDDGYFQRVLRSTINHDRRLSRWLRGPARSGRPRFGAGGRDWDRSILRVVRFRKQGVTQQPPRTDAGGWRSGDRLQVSFFDWRKMSWESWSTLARGRADADRLTGNYIGVSRYTRLRQPPRDKSLVRIPALVTAPLPGDADGESINAHISIGEVRYRVPDDCGRHCPDRQRPATLFNPFWEASLTRLEAPGLP